MSLKILVKFKHLKLKHPTLTSKHLNFHAFVFHHLRIVTNVPFGLASGGREDRDLGLPEASDTYGQQGISVGSRANATSAFKFVSLHMYLVAPENHNY